MSGKGNVVTNLHPEANPPAPWQPLRFQPAWVETENEAKFKAMMDVIAASAGEGRFGVVWDEAGRGKTVTTATWAARRRAPHFLMMETWQTSSLGFLQTFYRELKGRRYAGQLTRGEHARLMELKPPRTKNDCLLQIIDYLLEMPAAARVVFLDEMDLAPRRLSLVRQLAEITGTAFILIGERQMLSLMRQESRLWSRMVDAVRFEAAEAPAILRYGAITAGLRIQPTAAELLSTAPKGGDWRMIRNRTVRLTALANSRKTRDITDDLVHLIIQEEPRDDRL
jgi:hypothetical protein